ncbi:MAG: PEP-CTERM sorting domain-containing protein [Phycisphaeraceae bacterium]
MSTFTTSALTIAALIASPAFAANIAPTGTAALGYTNDFNGATVQRNHIGSDVDNAVVADSRLTDGVTTVTAGTTTVDTWSSGGTLTYEVAQVTFGSAVSGIDQVTINLVGFVDGGWFGTPGSNSTASGDLVVPTVQVTTDGGTTWTDVAGVTDDYIAQISSATIGGPDALPLATFDFAAQGPVDGIRLIGTPGGTASGGQPGFIGATEITVNQIPEPGSLALLGLGGLLVARRRRD